MSGKKKISELHKLIVDNHEKLSALQLTIIGDKLDEMISKTDLILEKIRKSELRKKKRAQLKSKKKK